MTGSKAQLASTSRYPVEVLLSNDLLVMQEKLNGRRGMVRVKDGVASFFNRIGEKRPLPYFLKNSFRPLKGDYLFDGEVLGKQFHVFDLTESPHLRENASWAERNKVLLSLEGLPGLSMVQTFWGGQKPTAFQRMKESHAEGVVFKDQRAPYRGGRTDSWIKYKFVHDVDCVVTAVRPTGRDNLELAVYAGQTLVPVGKVSALSGDGPRVALGDVVTVTVLDVSDSNQLIQPVTPMIRDDKKPEECGIDQLASARKSKLPTSGEMI